MKIVETEVCVIGAGPAGSTVARLLAELGHTVLLVEQSQFPRRRIGESFPPSILQVFDALGLRAAIEQAGFLRPAGTIVNWSSDGTVTMPMGAKAGFHVDRGYFDLLLLEMAVRQKVALLQPARACRPRRTPNGWVIPIRSTSAGMLVHARVLVDASGRRVGPRGSPRTLAMWGYWRGVANTGNEARVEATRDGWYWGAPLPDCTFNAAVFMDASSGAATRYREYVSRSTLLRHCLDGVMDGEVHACDATPYADDDPIGPNHLRVGEASYAVDPLSSQGVQHALSSALQGSIAMHTLLAAPANGEGAIEFYRARQAEAVADSARTAARIYAREDRFASEPFWSRRAAQPADVPLAHTERGPLPNDRALRLAAAARIVYTPVLSGDRIRRMQALDHPRLARPVAFLGGVALAPLMRQVSDGRTAGELARCWPLDLADSRRVLEWLWNTGLLDDERTNPGATIRGPEHELSSRTPAD